jgi:hypothetical protein
VKARLRRPAAPADALPAADGMPGPPVVEITARHVRIGDDYAATLAVTGYPAEVSPGWLEPLPGLVVVPEIAERPEEQGLRVQRIEPAELPERPLPPAHCLLAEDVLGHHGGPV